MPDWNPEIGLYGFNTTVHTAGVQGLTYLHHLPKSVNWLLQQALDAGRLDVDRTRAMLAGLRCIQERVGTGEHRGCLLWAAEETVIADTNAAFFVALPLLTLRATFVETWEAAHLDDAEPALFADLLHWFRGEAADHHVHYPNKYLGDLVCGWLLAEQQHHVEAQAEVGIWFERALAYWRDTPWGWGEHLSTGYGNVLLIEFSLLLLTAEHLPPSIRSGCRVLTEGLLQIQRAYAGGPIVPAIRSYAFSQPPDLEPFVEAIQATDQPDHPANPNRMFAGILKALAHLGWRAAFADLLDKPVDLGNPVRVACYGGVEAIGQLCEDSRLGTLSHFPLSPAWDAPTWGLSWQSMPVAWWADGQAPAWGFCQGWSRLGGGSVRAHPALEKSGTYLRNALSDTAGPVIVWRTRSWQTGGRALVRRQPTGLGDDWTVWGDRWLVVGGEPAVASLVDPAGRWQGRLLTVGKTRLAVWLYVPEGTSAVIDHGPAIGPDTTVFAWGAQWPAPDPDQPPPWTLWALELDPDSTLPVTPPLLGRPSDAALDAPFGVTWAGETYRLDA